MKSVGASVVLCATISSLPFGTELLVAGFGKQVEADARGEGVHQGNLVEKIISYITLSTL